MKKLFLNKKLKIKKKKYKIRSERRKKNFILSRNERSSESIRIIDVKSMKKKVKINVIIKYGHSHTISHTTVLLNHK